MLQRLLAIIRKELISMLRDRRARLSLVLPPLIQLFILSFAATMEVKNIGLAVVDLDRGPVALEIVQRLRGSPSILGARRVSCSRGRRSIARSPSAAA